MTVSPGWSSVWSVVGGRCWCAVALVVAAFVVVPNGLAAGWLPHAADATWTYKWTDSVYSPTPTTEKRDGQGHEGRDVHARVDDRRVEQPRRRGQHHRPGRLPGDERRPRQHRLDEQRSAAVVARALCHARGLPQRAFERVLQRDLGLALARPRRAAAPGHDLAGTGGAQNDVSAASTYLGTEQITVPAFQGPVTAAKVRSTITQAGALGDPYGSGTRTTWWVYGVGPVKIEFQHAGGERRPR